MGNSYADTAQLRKVFGIRMAYFEKLSFHANFRNTVKPALHISSFNLTAGI